MTMEEWTAMRWEFPEDRFRKMVQALYSGLTAEPLVKPSECTEETVA